MGLISGVSNWLSNFLRHAKNGFFIQTHFIGHKGPVWLDVNVPQSLYGEIPQLTTVVDRRSDMFSNMELFLENAKGERIEDKDFEKLIRNPNPLQSMNDWLKQYEQQKLIYGNQFLLKKQPSRLSKLPALIWNVSPAYCVPVLTGRIFDQTEIKGIVEKYEFQQYQAKETFETEDILWSRITDLDNPLIGKSKLYGLKFPLSNTKLAYEYRNVIMGERGMLGILINKKKDAMGSVPLTKEEKDRLEKQHTVNYGIGEGQKKIMITETDVDYKATSYPTKDMLLFEEVEANFKTICEHFGLNINIFFNSTFENVKNGIIQSYQDTIIPEADNFAQALTSFLGIKEGFKIRASYDHLQVLKSDEQKEAQTLKTRAEAITQMINGKIIVPEVGLELFNEITGLNLKLPKEGKIIDVLNRLSPLVANNVFESLTDNQILSIVGLPPVADGDTPRGRSQQQPGVSVAV